MDIDGDITQIQNDIEKSSESDRDSVHREIGQDSLQLEAASSFGNNNR